MTPQQLAGCLVRLQGAFPSEWDEARVTVWTDHLAPLDYGRANNALRAMEAEADFPTIAAFTRALKAENDRVVHEEGRMFLPGTGWVSVPRRELTP